MNTDQIEGKWEQVKGKVRQKWGQLTDQDLTTIDGKRQQLVGKIQEKYGYATEKAEKEVADFLADKKNGCCGSEGSSKMATKDTNCSPE